jgi:uncharacterized protein YcfJ
MIKKNLLLAIMLTAVLYGCANQPQRNYYGCQMDYAGATVGAVAGGIIGHQVGGGNGRTVATGAGAAMGAMIGSGCR